MKTEKRNDPNWAHVVIVGAGFGGLRVARRLSREHVRVTLVDRNNYHLFQPLLYQVATAGLSPDGIASPVRSIFRRHPNVEFQLADVCGVDFEHKRLLTNTMDIPYDYLVLAVGAETSHFGIPQLAAHSFGLKSLEDAIRFRNHILLMFEQAVQEHDPAKRREMLTFAVVGGGPTGVESAGAISELTRLVLAKEYHDLDLADVRVILLEARSRLLEAMPESLGYATAETLRGKHVEVLFHRQVVDYDGRRLVLKDGEIIATRTLLWAAGVRAASLLDALGVQQTRQQRVVVEPTLQLPGHPEVLVIGDAAYLEDAHKQPLPMVAPVALQMAHRAAANILALQRGEPLRPFIYKDPGTMATIGRSQAVAWLGRWKVSGFVAWLAWLFIHLVQLIGHRNRIIVLVNWVWSYIFYDRAIRLITIE